MRKLRKLTLDELAKTMPVVKEIEQRNYVGGDYVIINVNRMPSVGNSTASTFTATAYDDFGNAVGQVSGYFLEPKVVPNLATTAGSDTAISPGSYSLSKSTYNGNSGYYQVDNVPGRSQIKIHTGNYHDNTEGCFLPGSSVGELSGNATVGESDDKRIELTKLLDDHGDRGITFNVS